MRTCSVCSHPQLAEIDILLSAGGSVRAVARLHQLSRTTLSRHREHTHELAHRFGVIRGDGGPDGPVDPLAAGFELAARAKTERERLKSLEAIRGATALLLRSSQGEPDAEAVRQLDRNVQEAAEAFRSGSASFEQSIRALQGLREAIRQKLDARRVPGDVETRVLVTYPGADPEAEGTPVRMRAADYWAGIPQKFRDERFHVQRVVRLRFGAVRRRDGDPPDVEVKVRETATGALVWASERAVAATGGGDQ